METKYEWIKECHYRVSAKAILRNPEWKFALCMKEMKIDWTVQSNWDFPGGWIDHWEDVFETLEREIMEEMWLKVTNIKPSPKYFFIGESACWKVPLGLVFYETQVSNFDYISSDECRELRFFTLEEALEENLWPAVRSNLEEAKKLFQGF